MNCLEDVLYISVLKHDFKNNMGEVLPSIMHDGVVVIRGIQIICVLLLKVVCRCCAGGKRVFTGTEVFVTIK